MQALRWHGRQDIRVDDVPIPEPDHDEVLIKVMYSGICGSEVHEYLAGPIFIPLEPHPLTGKKAPQIMGHEFGGRVVARGSGVTEIALDALVTVNPILSCGQCAACRRNRPNLCEQIAYYGAIGDGGHAEYTVVKAANCALMPSDGPTEYVAFGEPAGIAYHAVNQAGVKPGDTVVVLGGGPIGQLVAQYTRQAGAGKVFMTELIPGRIAVAETIGALDAVFNPLECDAVEEILAQTDGCGADCAIECCGGSKTGMLEDTAAEAVAMTRAEGTTVMVGTFSDPSEFHFNHVVLMERRIIGSWVWHDHAEYRRAMQMINEGKIKIDPMISKKIRIENAVEQGIQRLHLENDHYLKILVDFT